MCTVFTVLDRKHMLLQSTGLLFPYLGYTGRAAEQDMFFLASLS